MPASMETLSTQKTFLIISATGVDTLVIRPLEWYQLSHTRPYSSTLTPFVQNPVVNFGQLLFGSKKVTFPHETLLSLHLWHSLPFRLLDPTFQTRAILRQKSQNCIFLAPALLYRTLLSTLLKCFCLYPSWILESMHLQNATLVAPLGGGGAAHRHCLWIWSRRIHIRCHKELWTTE